MYTICTVRTHINSDCEINQITHKITQHKIHWFASCPEHVINWLALVGADEVISARTCSVQESIYDSDPQT